MGKRYVLLDLNCPELVGNSLAYDIITKSVPLTEISEKEYLKITNKKSNCLRKEYQHQGFERSPAFTIKKRFTFPAGLLIRERLKVGVVNVTGSEG